jgi:hypothetical protein
VCSFTDFLLPISLANEIYANLVERTFHRRLRELCGYLVLLAKEL